MAKRTTPVFLQKAVLTVDQMTVGIQRLRKRIEDLESFDPEKISQRGDDAVLALEISIEETLSAVFGHQTVEYKRYSSASSLDDGPHILWVDPMLGGSSGPSVYEVRQYLKEGKQKSISLLNQAIRGLEEEITFMRPKEISQISISERSNAISRKIFIVHGHDVAIREAVARFIEKLGFTPIILHEQANQGRTIIEKVEAHSDVGFAIVLLTPDDNGAKKGEPLKDRVRQNVLLELGYFIGLLGRAKVCALSSEVGIELPTDFAGVIWQLVDASGAWKLSLAKELKATGYEVDWNLVME